MWEVHSTRSTGSARSPSFALHVACYKIRPEEAEGVVSVNHVGDSGRLQTVTREESPLYYDLISNFSPRDRSPGNSQYQLQRD